MVYDDTHGTLDSPRRPEQVVVIEGAAEFLKGLRKAGYFTVVVTNQPGIAKNTLSTGDLEHVNHRLSHLLSEKGAGWDELRFCPHHPTGGVEPHTTYVQECECRKPKPGMLIKAAADLNLDLGESWMVGDGLNDVQAGNAAGCRTILVANLKVEQVRRFFEMEDCEPDFVARDLKKALRIITGQGEGS